MSNLLNSELSFTRFTSGSYRWTQNERPWGRSGREPVLIHQIVSPSHISVVLISTSAPLIHLKLIFIIFEKIKNNQHSRDSENPKFRNFHKKCDVYGYRTLDTRLQDQRAYTYAKMLAVVSQLCTF